MAEHAPVRLDQSFADPPDIDCLPYDPKEWERRLEVARARREKVLKQRSEERKAEVPANDADRAESQHEVAHYDATEWERRLVVARAHRERILRQRADERERAGAGGPDGPAGGAEKPESHRLMAAFRSAPASAYRSEDGKTNAAAGAVVAAAPPEAVIAGAQVTPKPRRVEGRLRPLLLGLAASGLAGALLAGVAATDFTLIGRQGHAVPPSPPTAGTSPDGRAAHVTQQPLPPSLAASLWMPATVPAPIPQATAFSQPLALPDASARGTEPPELPAAALTVSLPAVAALPRGAERPVLDARHMTAAPAPDPVLRTQSPAVPRLAALAPPFDLSITSAWGAEPPALSLQTASVSLPMITAPSPDPASPQLDMPHRMATPSADADLATTDGAFWASAPTPAQPQMTYPTFVPDTVFARPAARISRVAVYSPARLASDRRDWAMSRLSETGWPTDVATTPYTIAETHVRYFHAADQTAAESLAVLLDTSPRDFTSFSPAPETGHLEVWLGGQGTPPQARPVVRRSPAPTTTDIVRTNRGSESQQAATGAGGQADSGRGSSERQQVSTSVSSSGLGTGSGTSTGTGTGGGSGNSAGSDAGSSGGGTGGGGGGTGSSGGGGGNGNGNGGGGNSGGNGGGNGNSGKG